MAPPQDGERSLYVKPPMRRFKPGESEKLDQYLADLELRTKIRPVSAVADLAMLPDGTTAKGYRYTSLGFNQLAYELSPGLSTIVPDLAGCKRKPEDELARFDLGAAIGVFNSVLALRFDLLKRQRMVCDGDRKLIDGLLGPKRQYLKNREMLQSANGALAGHRDIQFFAAELIGRRLTIWYRSIEPVFTISCRGMKHPFYRGYYFCNSESSGTGLRGTDVYFGKQGCALGPFRSGTRMAHVGRNFGKRSEKLFGAVVERDPNTKKVADYLPGLALTSLNVIGTEEERAQQTTKLVHTLTRGRKISKWVAQDVVQNALTVGADDKELAPGDLLRPQPFEKRTAYDLFCALIRRSRGLGLERRENVEHVAYELMLGKLKLGDR
jgi:hypothetical protein